MAVKDHSEYFDGIQIAPTPVNLRVPNTVSRSAGTGERSFLAVISESGKPVLDCELNLHQAAQWMEGFLLRRWDTGSGWLRGRSHQDAYCDWGTETAPVGITDDSTLVDIPLGIPLIHADNTLTSSLVLPRLEAVVAGYPVVVEFTNTQVAGFNLIGLSPAKIYDGTNATVKRTDFVFLEVWRALVAPSLPATAQVQVISVADIAPGDIISINSLPLTAIAVGPAGVDEFVIGGTETATATNIATAINDVGNSFATIVTAVDSASDVNLTAVEPGAGDAILFTGNFITLSVTVGTVGCMTVSGALFTGGEDRPNKPTTSQGQIFRHGNVLSPSPVWLDDEIFDPVANTETSQRIQLQYRIRVTDDSEAINYKVNPDGFSSRIAGGGPLDAAVFAQGNRAVPVWTGNGVDTLSFPFVPADGASTWLDTSAEDFGWKDDGLYVAGDGSEAAAQALGAIDGFVYAIPIAFVHRHNDASDVAAAIKGFDPAANTNGAPVYDHAGFVGVVGVIPAGASDRPDGHFCDVITQENLLDLRRHVVPSGIDLATELQYQVQSLLDGSLRTWSVDTASKQVLGGASGDVSTRYLICNEIGRTIAEGGGAPGSGESTDRGVLVRSYDHIARRFGDQPVVERVVIGFWPGDRDGVAVLPGTNNPGKYVTKDVASATTWYEGDVLHLDLEFLNATTLGGLFDSRNGAGDGGGGSGVGMPDQNFLALAPTGTVITDVLNAWHDDGHYTTPTNQNVQFGIIKGLGTTHVELTLDANDTLTTDGQPIAGPIIEHKMTGSGVLAAPADFGSSRRIFLEVEITYPIGEGTTDTPDFEVDPDVTVYSDSLLTVTGPGPLVENDILQRPADYELLLPARYRLAYREIQSEYIANDTIAHGAPLAGDPIGTTTVEQIVSLDRDTLRFPRRVWSDGAGLGLAVEDAPIASVMTVDVANSELGSSSRIIELDTALTGLLSGVGHTLCTITYFAQDPIPNYGVNGAGYQISYYFRSNAPQTAGTKEGDITSTGTGTLPTTLQVEPLLTSPSVWTGQLGMGGCDKSFPYNAPLDQIPLNDGTDTTEEWFFAATAEVAVADFDASTGLLNLHAFVQQDVQDILSLGGAGATEKPRQDAEFRAYYPFADDTAYRPTVMAQPLSGATRHKSFVPFLARAVADVPGVDGGLLFRKSELLLVVLSRFAELDAENNVRFVDPIADNRTLAAVYRTRNLLLTVGGRTCLGS